LLTVEVVASPDVMLFSWATVKGFLLGVGGVSQLAAMTMVVS